MTYSVLSEVKSAVEKHLAGRDLSQKSGTQIEELVKEAIIYKIGLARVSSDGSHSFPDLLIDDEIGIEVKSSRAGMKGMGNSILENTRVKKATSIYILFVRVGRPNTILIRPLEEVISGVAVTHSPRYVIDMDLAKGMSFFEAVGMAYDDFRSNENPARIVYRYYKKVKPNALPYWLDGLNETDELTASPVIELIKPEDIDRLRPLLFVYFPELFNKRANYKNCTLWMISRYSKVTPHMRDFFSSKGKIIVQSDKNRIKAPRVVGHLIDSIGKISEIFLNINDDLLADAWNIEVPTEEVRSHWLLRAIGQLSSHVESEILLEVFCHHVSRTSIYYDAKCSSIISRYTDVY